MSQAALPVITSIFEKEYAASLPTPRRAAFGSVSLPVTPLPAVEVPAQDVLAEVHTQATPKSSKFSWVKRILKAVGLSDPWFFRFFQVAFRRRGWLLENMTAGKAANLTLGMAEYALKREKVTAKPVMVKIDISPLCSLKCPACVHSTAGENDILQRQEFKSNQRMGLDDFRKIVGELKNRTAAVSLYYLGDPYVHPQHDEMCRIARDAGLNVHSSTHFSYGFSDERLRKIVKSGLTHLTVCVDGLTQATYGRTRIGGKIDQVLSNLKRLLEIRRELNSVYPKVEIQYLKFEHNLHELEAARKLLTGWGVDQFEEMWGITGNFTDTDPGRLDVDGPKDAKFLPMCFWPYSGMVVKWNGDVIPCCNFRHGEQYARDGESRTVGNVFKEGVLGVWNSDQYQAIRRSVNTPKKYNTDEKLEGNFCQGCPVLFNTATEANEAGTYHATQEKKFVTLTIGGKKTAAA